MSDRSVAYHCYPDCFEHLYQGLLAIYAQVQHSETGDALWVARARGDRALVYALDYVIERKSVKDLVGSIR